jgi:hypothetical protein
MANAGVPRYLAAQAPRSPDCRCLAGAEVANERSYTSSVSNIRSGRLVFTKLMILKNASIFGSLSFLISSLPLTQAAAV